MVINIANDRPVVHTAFTSRIRIIYRRLKLISALGTIPRMLTLLEQIGLLTQGLVTMSDGGQWKHKPIFIESNITS